MKLYNTLTKTKEEFVPVNKGLVAMYVCGVTVYGPLHMGHARTYVAYDMIRNYFANFKNTPVLFVQNITDVGHIVGDADEGEDKIQRRASQENKHPLEIVDTYIKTMWEGLDALKCDRPNIAPRATGHIVEIIDAVSDLLSKGYAYEADGTVYFDISKARNYGLLSGNDIAMLEKGVRIEVDERKRNPLDFALWKKAQPNHIMQWSSPWGKGFPGWHIECSVMSTKYLGLPFDIHGGAKELAFPHHENEIAQSESLYGQKMVNYWVHTGVLSINGQKMAKSLGNFVTVEDALRKHSAGVVRYFILSQHYAAPVDMKEEALQAAKSALDRINNFVFQLRGNAKGKNNTDLTDQFNKFRTSFEASMDDDFSTPSAMAHLFNFMNTANKTIAAQNYDSRNVDEIIGYIGKLNTVFKCFDIQIPESAGSADIDKLIEQREKARQEKNWALADQLRDKLREMNVEIFDNKQGKSLYKLKK